MDPNAQNPVSPAVPTVDPNAGMQMPPPEPVVPATPEPAPVMPEPQAPVIPVDGTGDAGTGMPPVTPPSAI